MPVARLKVPGDARFNPGPRTFCDKCSTREGLNFAYAYGKPIFLCEKHFREWFKLARVNDGNNDLTREQPFKQQARITDKDIPLEHYFGKQSKKVF